MLKLKELLKGPRGHQMEIASKCNLSRTLISLLKAGKRKLTLEVASRIAEATGTEAVLHLGEIRFKQLPKTFMRSGKR